MIDFSATEESAGMVSFLDSEGDIVASYPVKELEVFVEDFYGSELIENQYVGNTGNGMDLGSPEYDTTEEVQIISVEDYIDDNWKEVTQKFWEEKHKS